MIDGPRAAKSSADSPRVTYTEFAPSHVPSLKPSNPPLRPESPPSSGNATMQSAPPVETAPPSGDRVTVHVATYDGLAEVTDGSGQPLGSTPYALSGPVGKTYELWLRRPGYQSRHVDVQINLNKTEYLFGLEKQDSDKKD